MQTSKEHLMAQQKVMAAKNLYNGKIDGIWGPKSIAAKQKWERSGKFAPAIPNNGFPLNDRQPLPPGVSRKPDGSITCIELDAKQEKTTLVAAPGTESVKVSQPIEIQPEAPTETKSGQQGNNQQKNNQQK